MTILSPHTLAIFAETLGTEVGLENLQMILGKADLDASMTSPAALLRLSGPSVPTAYANIQAALRSFYGRGARGTLLRIGRLMWTRLLDKASLPEKTRLGAVKLLPVNLRTKPALEGLIALLRQPNAELGTYSLDLDVIFVEHVCATSHGQTSSSPFCFVTIGLIQECLYWATGKEMDVQEINCKGCGEPDCKFKITSA